ncbi:hypothetical protein [Paenibacillus sp. UNC499MF]|uniref:hypothetical protein n=1 Tax=Paenibacillus sp. UNC499MF TaxID=1502751 RepID=UPI00089FF842|nr:hypothetical protein [Paenibacillus sp. UNC499MF]SEG53694.1 hypothetical protein SAMN02799616_03428 [Paenibacillus sp. UNC499MF]
MKRKKWLIGLILLCLAAGIYAVIRFNIDPTLAPEDIKLRARVVPAAEKPAEVPSQASAAAAYATVVEVELESTGGKALNQEGYSYKVYPYVQNGTVAAWEPAPDSLAKGQKTESYAFGADNVTMPRALEMIERLTGASTNEDEAKKAGMSGGFVYTGETFPAKVRYYAKDAEAATGAGSGTDPKDGRTYILFSYHEKKWGKDVSWVKAVKVAP